MNKTSISDKLSTIRDSVKVRDIMSKDVVTLSKERSVQEAVNIMAKKTISTVVVKEEGKAVGIITERDIIARIVAKNKDPKKAKLGDVMTHSPKTINPDDPILKASSVMKSLKVR